MLDSLVQRLLPAVLATSLATTSLAQTPPYYTPRRQSSQATTAPTTTVPAASSSCLPIETTAYCADQYGVIYSQEKDLERRMEVLDPAVLVQVRQLLEYTVAVDQAKALAAQQEAMARREGIKPASASPISPYRPVLQPRLPPAQPSWVPPREEPASQKNKSNDWAGYLLTGLGVVLLAYGILSKDKCEELGGDEFECPDHIKSEQRNARILVIGGSVAATSLGIYFLAD